MNQTLLLAILCVASVSSVELEKLCSSDVFEYKGVLVNAFHRVQWNVTLEPLSRYLVNDSVRCDPTQFQNQSNFWEALRIKRV